MAACTSNGTGANPSSTWKNDPVRQAFTNSTSSVMVTSSPTRMPPVSSAAFHVRPKSLRLIVVTAEIGTRVLPHGSFAGGVGPSTAKLTLR